jgi:hypothetical protein
MLYYMLSETELTIFGVFVLFIAIILLINKNNIFSSFQNNTTTSVSSELDENGFVKSNIVPSYWYNYASSEVRSKCFDCDATSQYRHPSNCIDCETKGGRPVDKLLNRVLTR